MRDTRNEEWFEELPAPLSLSSRTLIGDKIVFETRLELGAKEPGAWIEITDLTNRRGRLICQYTVHGDEILTNADKRAIAKHDTPRLVWTEPFETPVTIFITDDLDVTIPSLKRKQVHGTQAQYEWRPTEVQIRDLRPGLMIKRVPPNPRFSRGNDDGNNGPTFAEVQRASIESSYTRNPKQSVDREAGVVSVVTSPEQREEADRMRERHRLEQLLAEHHRQIPLAKGKHLVRLTLSLADVERKLGDLQEEYAEAA